MWVERLLIENIRSFEEEEISFLRHRNEPYRWVTLLVHAPDHSDH